YAPGPGDVLTVPKGDGETVEKGETIAVLRNEELEAQIADLTGKLKTAEERKSTITRQLFNPGKIQPGELANLKIQKAEVEQEIATHRSELKIKTKQLEKLTVTAPISGRIITWDVKQSLLGRPVQMGDSLMMVADENSEWQLELFMPERRAGKLRKAMLE